MKDGQRAEGLRPQKTRPPVVSSTQGGFEHVETLALRDAFDDIHKYYIG